MSYRGVRNWPPVWTLTRSESARTLRGEIGVLKYVHYNTIMSNKCFLVINFQADSYIGSLIFKDPALCKQISHLLSDHIGRAIKDIGDLDVSHLL
jgi:hypothetical protein